MPGKRIPQLDAIAGASTANDDNLVIYDTDAGTTKRILRSQLAAGLVGDLPYTPSGGIAATTVPTAIAELDSEAAKSAALAAAGGAALIGFTPVGAVSAATVQAAIAEVDSEAAKSAALAAAGGAALIGNTPAGTIAATTVQGAINELDADTAKTGAAQTFTAQQTLTSGLVLQSIAAADIAAVANAINTANKVAGKVVYDTTNKRLMVADGAAAADPWYVADGSTSVTPA
jgi:hypothetical protein